MADERVTILVRLRDAASGALKGLTGRFKALDAAGVGLRRVLGSLGLAFSALAAIRSSLSAMRAFETRVSEIATIAPGGAKQVALLRDNILQLSRSVPQSPDELGAGVYQILSAGFTDTADAAKILEVSAKAAVAGLTDTATAVDAVTTVLNAWNLGADQAARVADVLFETVRLGKLRFEDIASTIGTAATSAALAGVSIEETTAAIATMTLAGIDATEAASSLNRLFLTLTQQTAGQEAAFRKLGIEFNTTTVKEKGFAGLLEEVNKLTEGQIDALSELFPNIRAARSAFVLAGNSLGRYNEILAQTTEANGSALRAFNLMNQSLDNQTKILKNELNVAVQELGTTVLPKMTGAVRVSIQAFKDWRFISNAIADETTANLSRMTSQQLVFALSQRITEREALRSSSRIRRGIEAVGNATLKLLSRGKAPELTDLFGGATRSIQELEAEIEVINRLFDSGFAQAKKKVEKTASETDNLNKSLGRIPETFEQINQALNKAFAPGVLAFPTPNQFREAFAQMQQELQGRGPLSLNVELAPLIKPEAVAVEIPPEVWAEFGQTEAIENAIDALARMRTEANELGAATETSLNQAIRALAGLGQTAEEIADRLDTSVDRVKAVLGSVPTEVANDVLPRMRAVGVQAANTLIDGIISGTLDKEDFLKAVLAGLFKAVVFGSLGIQSPSRLGIDAGRSISEGIGLGIMEGLPSIDAAMGSVTASIAELGQASIGITAQGTQFALDVKNLPAPSDPRQAARDRDWLRFLDLSNREAKFHGMKGGR